RRAANALSPILSVRVLAAGLIALVAVRTGLSLAEHDVVDVGYASVIGAHRIVNGQSLYYASTAHGDTYGPIAYLAYVPFELLFPWHGAWDYLASAHAASIFFDLATIVGLVALGRRLGGRDGLRLGLVLGWAWAACPFTLLALMMHTNDGLVAMLSVLSLLAFSSPAARGALLGLAAAAKFAPAALLGLYAGQRDRGIKGAVVCLASFAVIVVTAIGLYLPSGGLSEFYNHTLGFQLHRSDVFSPWGLNPGLGVVKTVVEAGALGLCALVAFVPYRRSLAQVCALAAAITIAVQLPAVHWFYYFIVWFMPFVLVALLAPGEEDGGADEPPVAVEEAPPNLEVRTRHPVAV
ncbi:MAG TPA: glycosyltransferase 87 family protein, partial [Solirubrobacteraceae bacterium]